MKIALIGYGKMGKTIEQIALGRGHQIVSIVDINNPEEIHSDVSTQQLFCKTLHIIVEC